jgi:hypothetical protein
MTFKGPVSYRLYACMDTVGRPGKNWDLRILDLRNISQNQQIEEHF